MSLPPLIPFHGRWDDYLEYIYGIYMDEVVSGGLVFNGLPVRCRYHPETFGKGFGFWHCIQEGGTDKERLPDLRRCERISWIAWAIQNTNKDPRVTWWEEKRNRENDTLIWLEQVDSYLVVLSRRRSYFLLKTAYCALNPHKIKSLRKNRSRFQQGPKN